MSPSTLAQRLVLARTEAGLTQDDLANRVGLKQTSYGELETGRSKSTSKIGSLAHVLRVRALWLETGDGPMRFEGVAETPSEYLADDERELLSIFRKLKPEKRAALLRFVRQG